MTASFVRALTVLASAVLVLAGQPGVPATARMAVDDYAGYDGQVTCATEVLPGTDYLLAHLVRTHPGTRYVSTLRDCSGDNTSEHKDGRALDWGVDADVPAEKAVAEKWLDTIFAPDAQGNPHALARRMGIMYVIWDDRIFSAYHGFEPRPYQPCERLRDCSKTLRHRDHVHVSLSRAGAAAQTSFYRMRGVPSVPVLYPRTQQLDPVSTAEVTFEVPATGRAVTTDFKLVRGETYRVVADGLVRLGAGSRVGDAACRWSGDGWAPSKILRVSGTNPWGTTCNSSHTYEALYSPTVTDFLTLRVGEADSGTAEGTLTFSILRVDLPAATVAVQRNAGSPAPQPARRPGPSARALQQETVTVKAASPLGAITSRALRPGVRYRVVVTGVALSGETSFDGQCVRYADAWRPQHTLDLGTPSADHLSLFVAGTPVTLRAPGSSGPCDARSHRYVGVLRPSVGGRARVRIWDPYTHQDNQGALSVVLTRL